MKITSLKCPYCGASLDVEEEGYVKCRYCHNTFLCEEDKPPVTINNTVNNYGLPASPAASAGNVPGKGKTGVLLLISVLVLLLLALFMTTGERDSGQPEIEEYSATALQQTVAAEPLLAELVRIAYPYTTPERITSKDMARMRSVQIGRAKQIADTQEYEFEVTYALEDGQEQSVLVKIPVPDGQGVDYMAFSCFDRLEAFGWDMATAKSDDISGLASFLSLKALSIVDHDQISDFSALGKCVGLTDLSVRGAGALDDLSFMRSMTKIKNISLRDTSVSDLSPLTGKISIMSLILEGNPLDDISAVETLTSLTRLHIDGMDGQPADMKNLQLLTDYTWNGEKIR